tara:strand:- start:18698 stop:18925 length:228 start_codon:yes stop_codon:yes gene_type:complete
MKPETLKILKTVVLLLDNGLEPSSLERVLSGIGCEYNNGVNYELYYFIKRLDLFFDEDFNSKTLVVDRFDLYKVK